MAKMCKERFFGSCSGWMPAKLNQHGGIFVVRRDQMGRDPYILLQSVAPRCCMPVGRHSKPNWQRSAELPLIYHLITTLATEANDAPMPPLLRPENLQFDNGWGGFSPDGREYLIYVEGSNAKTTPTPAPWINVIANPEFGFLASESGGGYTWACNSGENRLTSWRNDPVTDMPAEAIYVRDEETGQIWSPTPLPAPTGAPYLVRHGAGYTSYDHHAYGVEQRVRLFVAPDAPVKFIQLRVRNRFDRPRRLTVTLYAEWVLGLNRMLTAPMLLPEYVGDGKNALLAINPYNAEFAEAARLWAPTNRSMAIPRIGLRSWGVMAHMARRALKRIGLSNSVQAGHDSCAVLQIHINLPPEGEEEFLFVVGQGDDRAHAETLLEQYCDADAAATAWSATMTDWEAMLGAVRVETPDPAMDLLLNRQLLYQALACRIWGRSALYQSSGAYGFRDQLQDVMALVHTRPDLLRAQLLRAARHQFVAGDVLHWWHPPSGRGVRTRISDDLLWLPFVTAHYVAVTGDVGVLEEEVPFLEGEPLPRRRA